MSVRRVVTACVPWLLASAVILAAISVSAGEAERRVQVFNGKNLDGWEVLRCEAGVDSGSLVLQDGNGLVCLKGRYGDFVLELKWRPRRDSNWDSGIYFRCDLPPAGPRPWPRRYQANLRQGMEGNVGGLPGAESEGLLKPGTWNEMKLTVSGRTAKLELNGKPAWEAEGLEQAEGIIALQAEVPNGGQFEFKDIYVTKLSETGK